MTRARGLLARVALVALAACGKGGADAQVVRGTAVDHGRALFADPTASPSASNAFSCATCHPAPDGASSADATNARIFPGAALAGATARASFWGGQRLDLLEAINDCRALFMDAPSPWTADDEEARALYAYLASTDAPAGRAPAPFTLARGAPDLPPGDATAGRDAYARACMPCHGAAHGGAGRLVTFAPRLPDDVDAAHAALGATDRRLVYLRKAREGEFVQASGAMPPFSKEALSDADLASILAFLGQY